MNKHQLMRVFATVVDAGSFVAAADALGMSKAAISRYVSDLEQRLGVRLMHRTTRKLFLAQEGEVFLARCQEILASIGRRRPRSRREAIPRAARRRSACRSASVSNTRGTCVAATVRETGIEQQPTLLIARELASGRLVEVLPQYRWIELGVYAVYPTCKFVLPKVRALLEFLSARLARADWG